MTTTMSITNDTRTVLISSIFIESIDCSTNHEIDASITTTTVIDG